MGKTNVLAVGALAVSAMGLTGCNTLVGRTFQDAKDAVVGPTVGEVRDDIIVLVNPTSPTLLLVLERDGGNVTGYRLFSAEASPQEALNKQIDADAPTGFYATEITEPAAASSVLQNHQQALTQIVETSRTTDAAGKTQYKPVEMLVMQMKLKKVLAPEGKVIGISGHYLNVVMPEKIGPMLDQYLQKQVAPALQYFQNGGKMPQPVTLNPHISAYQRQRARA